MPSAAEVLLPVIQKKLDGQIATLESARTRAAVALTASGVIAGLFVTRFGKSGNLGEYLALVAFVAGSIASVLVLFGRTLTVVPKGDDWIRYAKDSDQNYSEFVEAGGKGEDLSGIRLATIMAEDMQSWYSSNERTLGRAQSELSLAWVAVVLQTVFWAAAEIWH